MDFDVEMDDIKSRIAELASQCSDEKGVEMLYGAIRKLQAAHEWILCPEALRQTVQGL